MEDIFGVILDIVANNPDFESKETHWVEECDGSMESEISSITIEPISNEITNEAIDRLHGDVIQAVTSMGIQGYNYTLRFFDGTLDIKDPDEEDTTFQIIKNGRKVMATLFSY